MPAGLGTGGSHVRAAPSERRAVALAVAAHFFLMGSYYVMRPVRDTVAITVGTARLQTLFTATFVGTVFACLLYTALASRIRLSRLLPGLFACWFVQVVAFAALFHGWRDRPLLAAAYYVWFSVSNLFMVSTF